LISIVIPARDEEAWLGATLDGVAAARERLADEPSEVVVVDHASTDGTARVAASRGARVVSARRGGGVGAARNAGARAAAGDALVFLDADVAVPPELLERIAAALADPACLGGAPDTVYRPRRPAVRAYLRAWRVLSRTLRMAQGTAQFCRREVFEALGGYDETIYMGEDVEFVWRMRRLARSRGGHVAWLREVGVVPSTRRYDTWPLWRILVYTNPLFIRAFMRRERTWGGWYRNPPR